jgi:hypothetical protein
MCRRDARSSRQWVGPAHGCREYSRNIGKDIKTQNTLSRNPIYVLKIKSVSINESVKSNNASFFYPDRSYPDRSHLALVSALLSDAVCMPSFLPVANSTYVHEGSRYGRTIALIR